MLEYHALSKSGALVAVFDQLTRARRFRASRKACGVTIRLHRVETRAEGAGHYVERRAVA